MLEENISPRSNISIQQFVLLTMFDHFAASSNMILDQHVWAFSKMMDKNLLFEFSDLFQHFVKRTTFDSLAVLSNIIVAQNIWSF